MTINADFTDPSRSFSSYQGMYIAIADFDMSEVLTSGPDLVDVYREAVAKGYKDPVVFYVPESGVTYIY